jgi:hypothetical protein
MPRRRVVTLSPMNADIKPGTLWRNQSNVSVQVTSLGFLRVGLGKSTKTPAVIYQSQHDGELTARSVAEFLRLFSPL